MKNITALLFDMDGVLVDNDAFHFKSFEIFCKKYGITFSSEFYTSTITGRTNEAIMRALFGEGITLQEVNKLAFEKEKIYRDIFKPYIKLPNGLLELLELANKKNVSCAVASNGPFENIDFVLDETGIRKYFTVAVNATMVKEGKPAPDIYLKAAELLGKTVQECVVFEDSPTGIKAAVAANIKVIGLSTTHKEDELKGTEFIVSDFTDKRLQAIFEK
jgi:beta-phosphoglucomutase